MKKLIVPATCIAKAKVTTSDWEYGWTITQAPGNKI